MVKEMDEEGSQKPLEGRLRDLLEKRRTNGTLRKLTLQQRSQIDFSSNDFLSLATSPQLKTRYLDELQKSGLPQGSGGSRLLDGNSTYAEDLERDIAHFHGAEAGLLFNSGFDANAGFFACVPQQGDVIVHDELVHASVHDGMRMARARKTLAFRHNSIEDLKKVLRKITQEDKIAGRQKSSVIVAVESIYSMDGDVAPLKEIIGVVEELVGGGRGYVVVDEAHSTGVLGPLGRGLVCELGLEHRIFARLHTFGKALASNGGEYQIAAVCVILSNHTQQSCSALTPYGNTSSTMPVHSSTRLSCPIHRLSQSDVLTPFSGPARRWPCNSICTTSRKPYSPA
jgi:8-amino-7-oxononanoate synthase